MITKTKYHYNGMKLFLMYTFMFHIHSLEAFNEDLTSLMKVHCKPKVFFDNDEVFVT